MTEMAYPRMVRVRQTFAARKVDDPGAEVAVQLQGLGLEQKVRAGETVAITVGSRGIANIPVIIQAAVEHLKSLGAQPFIVPAMGSHGGGTAEGQQAVIEGYGVTSDFVGAPIRSSMETVVVAQTPDALPVHFDRNAYEADHVIVAGRVKPHTRFVGEIESGLHKMMLIGLGKHNGARVYHRAIMEHSFGQIIRTVAGEVLKKCNILCGLAIVENAYDETALIEAVPPELFYDREVELLRLARSWLPTLPVTNIDLLIVDRIGKDISGTGMDTNIIGRKFNDHKATPQDDVVCKRIFVRGLTGKTRGNATGIGIAEFTTQACVDQIDRAATNTNAVTGEHPESGMIPLVYLTDREAIEAALQTIGLVEPPDARVVHIRDTLHLAELELSEACLADPQCREVKRLGLPAEMAFDVDGTLQDV
jgi:hypothetical protein